MSNDELKPSDSGLPDYVRGLKHGYQRGIEDAAKLRHDVYMEFESQTINSQSKKTASYVCDLYAKAILALTTEQPAEPATVDRQTRDLDRLLAKLAQTTWDLICNETAEGGDRTSPDIIEEAFRLARAFFPQPAERDTVPVEKECACGMPMDAFGCPNGH